MFVLGDKNFDCILFTYGWLRLIYGVWLQLIYYVNILIFINVV